MSPGDYYCPLDTPDETYEEDGIPKFEEPHKYIKANPEQLKWLIIEEPYAEGIKTFRYQYLNGTKAFMVHSVWPDGSEEIIHSVDTDSKHILVTRTLREPQGAWSTTECNLIDENEDLMSFIQDWSFDERKDFCHIANKTKP